METIKITFGSNSVYRFALRVTIFDGDDRIICEFRADTATEISISPGIYTIRLELNGILKDHILRLYKDEKIAFRIIPEKEEWKDAMVLDLPMIYSSIPFEDSQNSIYKSSHEYYSNECKQLSQQSTTTDQFVGHSSLFIFFRFPNHEQFAKLNTNWPPLFKDVFFLYDQKYILIQALDESNSVINGSDGFIAFNIAIAPGTYYIKISQNAKTYLIPVQVFANWHSQVFMTLGETPLFGTLRVILSRERRFDSRSPCNKYIDILTDKIQNNECELSGELIKFVAAHKSESPMLAFLCIYAYMNGNSDLNDDVIGKMIKVLDQLILVNNLKTPDIRVIELLNEKYLNTKKVQSREPFSGVPMLRLGVEVVSEEAMQWADLVTPNGMLDYAIEGLQRSSVFTVFEWNENRVVQEVDSQIVTAKGAFSKDVKEMLSQNLGEPTRKKITAQELLNASDVFLSQLEEQAVSKIEEIKVSVNLAEANQNINLEHIEEIKNNVQSTETAVFVADYVLNNPSMSFEEVSNNLNIPQPTVERVLSKDDSMQNPEA